jgi:ankyrin repeat protein
MTQIKRSSAYDDFFVAVITGKAARVEELLAENPEALQWKTPDGYTPLQMAVLNGRDKVASVLIQAQVSPMRKTM